MNYFILKYTQNKIQSNLIEINNRKNNTNIKIQYLSYLLNGLRVNVIELS
jgi:hypothetical protein